MNKYRDDDLPETIGVKLMTFLRETNGEYEVMGMPGFVEFVAEYGDRYPVLRGLAPWSDHDNGFQTLNKRNYYAT